MENEIFNASYPKANVEIVLSHIATTNENIQKLLNAFPKNSNKIYLILNQNPEEEGTTFNQIILFDDVQLKDADGHEIPQTNIDKRYVVFSSNPIPTQTSLVSDIQSLKTLMSEVNSKFAQFGEVLSNLYAVLADSSTQQAHDANVAVSDIQEVSNRASSALARSIDNFYLRESFMPAG